MNTPAVGRVVHYYTRDTNKQSRGVGAGPYAAVITQVFGVEDGSVSSLVNLKVSPPNRDGYHVGSVHGEGGDTPLSDLHSWWIWPPRV